jgi:hypothetical protein
MVTEPMGFVPTPKPKEKELEATPQQPMKFVVDTQLLVMLLLFAVILLSATALVQAARR